MHPSSSSWNYQKTLPFTDVFREKWGVGGGGGGGSETVHWKRMVEKTFMFGVGRKWLLVKILTLEVLFFQKNFLFKQRYWHF